MRVSCAGFTVWFLEAPDDPSHIPPAQNTPMPWWICMQRGSVQAIAFWGGHSGTQPALEVTLSPEQQRLLELLHEQSDWVITLDRFFPLDYYDSPNEPYLSKTARKYVLDYAPEFGEGLGHRMMLTTGSRDEIGSLLGRAMNELGFAAVDQSVRQLLQYLKTVSGRLALQALGSSTSAAAAVGLGVVTAWLQSRGRLGQAVLVPVDLHPQLFSNKGSRDSSLGDRRCDLVLFALKRNIVEASFHRSEVAPRARLAGQPCRRYGVADGGLCSSNPRAFLQRESELMAHSTGLRWQTFCASTLIGRAATGCSMKPQRRRSSITSDDSSVHAQNSEPAMKVTS